jgi:hypothetical protein
MMGVCRRSAGSSSVRIVFAWQRKSRTIYDFGKFFDNLINRKFFVLKKFIGQHKGGS